MQKSIAYLVAFFSGASIMILELVGSRIIAPYVGTSIFVWASLISIILGSLSIGYWLGGYLSDKKKSYKFLSLTLLSSAIYVALIGLTKDVALMFLQNVTSDIRILALLSSLIFFSIPTILLGIVSPYLAKLTIDSIKESGKAVGNLYAISTIGSIAGTLSTGFFLISYFGNTSILYIVSVVLILCSALIWTRGFIVKAVILIFILLFHVSAEANPLEVDTKYNKVTVIDSKDSIGRPLRILKVGNEHHSAMYLDSKELVFEYTKYYDLISVLKPDFTYSLKIGGGAYSYPKHYLEKFPHARIDVVEIDPEITDIAKKHFELKDNPRMKIFNEDGRTYLNNTKKKYDTILIDVFLSYYSIPYQLTTKEAVSIMKNSLKDDGVVILNVISSLEGENSKFFKSEYKTYKQVFPRVVVLPTIGSTDRNAIQNIMLIASKSNDLVKMENEYVPEDLEDNPILTDDFAPVDQYIMSFLKE